MTDPTHDRPTTERPDKTAKSLPAPAGIAASGRVRKPGITQRLRPKNWTIRVRLTVLYGGLFFLAGVVLLGLTYLMVKHSLQGRGLYGGRPPGPPGLPGPQGVDPFDRMVADFRLEQARFRSDALNLLLGQGALALAVVGFAALWLGWLLSARVLAPLSRITDTAGRIASSRGRGLHERIALAGPADEITRLADTFDEMLERLDRSFDGQRRFVANASHELRTPLAINSAVIELAITKPGAARETIELGETLLAINARHERLIDGLLTLADSENPISEASQVDLADVVAQVTAAAAPAANEAGIQITNDSQPAPTSGDPILLERLVQNLVENAVRHNDSGGWVRIRCGLAAPAEHQANESAPEVEVVVSNTGRLIHPYQLETIFLPFRRLAGERAGRGFGLGLSIVNAIAKAHGGRVTATPRDGGGLVLTVRLPARR